MVRPDATFIEVSLRERNSATRPQAAIFGVDGVSVSIQLERRGQFADASLIQAKVERDLDSKQVLRDAIVELVLCR